jgi:three-Cys-motif partner protein
MGKNRLSTSDWFISHAGKLKDTMDQVSDIEPDIFNEYRDHTALKLMCIGYWSNVFTTIIDKLGPPTIFIDICSGSGLTRVKDKKKFLPGSTIVADTYAHKHYKFIICVEENVQRGKVLEKRLSRIRSKDSFIVIKGRVEDNIEKMEEILREKKGFSFTFIDPEGLAGLTWEVFDRISNFKGDIMITWDHCGIWRLFCSRDSNPGNVRLLNTVYGNNSWQSATSNEELTQSFINRLKLKRDIVKDIDISDKSRIVYKELLCAKETKGGSPWISAFDDLKKRVEIEDARSIDLWLKIAYGEQGRISDY